MRQPITISLSPNSEPDDVALALKTLISPGQWLHGKEVDWVRKRLSSFFGTPHVFLCASGRMALTILLAQFGIKLGDEVILQAFTCVVVPNSIRAVGATPVYVDIDRSYNIDPEKLEAKITKNTKAVIVQHTFGIAADIEKIKKIVQKYNVLLIEDLAHAFGNTYKGKKLGTFGDGAFVSFGRDKTLSSVFGGAGIINNKSQISNLKSQIEEIEQKLGKPSMFWIAQQLFHPIAFSFILPLYDVFGLGKIILFFFQKINALSIPVTLHEKKGIMETSVMTAFPNALAILAKHQLEKFPRYLAEREKTVSFYTHLCKGNAKLQVPDLPKDASTRLLRYPILVKDPTRLIKFAKKQKIYLGNWYHNIIDPETSDFRVCKYVRGSCPVAEDHAKRIVNLPTRVSLAEAKIVISFIKNYYTHAYTKN